VIRPIEERDEEQFIALALGSGEGITSLPKNIKLLKNKLAKSIDSFSKKIQDPGNELYLFVLENSDDGKLGGMAGIYAKTGYENPAIYYCIDEIDRSKMVVDGIPLKSIKYLRLVSYTAGPTENCSLYLHASYRHSGLGKLLSLSRLMYITARRARFDKQIIANLRGFIDKSGNFPFWEELGRRFLDIEFSKVQDLIHHIPSIALKILPDGPIYLSLLSETTQEFIGSPHERTVPAQKILMEQGFIRTNEIDPFDGGPKLIADTDKLKIVAGSTLSVLENIFEDTDEHALYIISNDKDPFRCCTGIIHLKNNLVGINRSSAKILHLEKGDKVRYYKIFEESE